MYRPLPECVTIRKSGIEGLGLFAVKDIPIGTNLGESHRKDNADWLRAPLGAFYNHSESPNCIKSEVYKNPFRTWMNLLTLREIKAGEELTVNYTLYKVK